MAIRKGVISYSVLFDDEIYDENEIQNMPVSVILEECNTGSMIGNYDDLTLSTLTAAEVHQNLLEMGNNGTFFGED